MHSKTNFVEWVIALRTGRPAKSESVSCVYAIFLNPVWLIFVKYIVIYSININIYSSLLAHVIN